MIVAEQKPLEEIKGLLGEAGRILIVGGGTCVTVGFAFQGRCEGEYPDATHDRVTEADSVLSLGCGVGVQALAERYPNAIVVPGLDTKFMGLPVEQGVWAERCAACGACILGLTGGTCPIARRP